MGWGTTTGLLGGIADGIKQGLLTYQTTKNIQHQNQMQELLTGTTTDENGNLTYTPEKQAEIKQKKAMADYEGQKYDATSPISKHRYDQYHSIYGDKIQPGLAAQEYEDELKPLELKQKSEDTALYRHLLAGDKAKPKEKDWTDFGKDIDPNAATRGPLKSMVEVKNRFERLNPLWAQYPDLNQMPKSMIHEVVAGHVAGVNGGSPHAEQLHEMIPASMRGDASAIESWLGNHPVGSQQRAFLEAYKQSGQNEINFAKNYIHDAVGARLGNHESLFSANPERFRRVMHDQGFDDDELDSYGHYMKKQGDQKTQGLVSAPTEAEPPKKGLLQKVGDWFSSDAKAQAPAAPQAPPSLTAEDLKTIEWAKAHPKDPLAIQFLKAHGIQ